MQEREASNLKYKSVNWDKKITTISPLDKVAGKVQATKKYLRGLRKKKLKLIKWLFQMVES